MINFNSIKAIVCIKKFDVVLHSSQHRLTSNMEYPYDEDESVVSMENISNVDMCIQLDMCISQAMKSCIGSDQPILSYVFNMFEQFANDRYKDVSITEVINTTLYHWYYGNLASQIATLVFHPGLLHGDLGNPDSGYNLLFDYSQCMSQAQVHDAFQTLFRLVINYGLSVTQEDYYGETPFLQLKRTVSIMREKQIALPSHIEAAVPAFLFVFGHGKDGLMSCLQRLVRGWREKVVKKKTRAANVIKAKWLEAYYNPYTKIGRKRMAKAASTFCTRAVTIV